MYEWNETVQKMITWIEKNIEKRSPLLSLSKQIGYSTYYCSNQFHSITGMTLRDYITGRRVSRAAIDIRDTDERILDIAIKYGFSSQEAFTRAFAKAFGTTPRKYRISQKPIPLAMIQEVFSPYHYSIKENIKSNKKEIKIVEIKIEVIPAHKFIGVWDINAKNYYDFFMTGRYNCDDICGTIESMSPFTLKDQLTQMAGWFYEGKEKGYFYGIPVSQDYDGEIPEGMECKEISSTEYIVFYHPPFDYLKDNDDVMKNVENIAWSFDPNPIGYAWDESKKQIYQRHFPELYGYAILRPVKKI
ncbi:AraC family transcriptional regulator [Wukongibacter baidiensis]|uniref:helix-turn-helix transcriptional regulator n=1 Tax=Wukongibacter baidiensis TaxID=1723361 RepID=UPI003D7F77C4